MSERRFLVIHFNGKWDGTSYVGGISRGKVIHDEHINLSSLRSLVNSVLKDANTSASDYQIVEVANVKGDSVIVNIDTDDDVESLFRTTHSPVIYVSRLGAQPEIIEPFIDGVVGSCSSFTQPGGFLKMMDTFNALKDVHLFNDPSQNIPELGEDSLTSNDDIGIEVDHSSDESYGDYESFEDPTEINPEILPECARPWSILCMPSILPPPPVDVPNVNFTPGVLKIDDIFVSKEEMCTSVGFYHLTNKVEYRVRKSDPGRWVLKCKHANCEISFRAGGKHGFWKTTKLTPHTCAFDPNRNAPQSLPSKVVGSFYAARQQEKSTSMTPTDILGDLKLNHGMNLQYSQALRSAQRAMNMIYGDPEESFNMLPSYLDQLLTANPGSHIKLHTDDEDRFKYCFFALRASINGFINYGRLVIVVDGTHLKGKYKGVVFIAVTQDSNNQVFPLATGIGDVESNESWTWFFDRLREAYSCPDDLLIVSDQHKGIIHAVETVYPEAKHGFCYYHIQKKFASYGRHIIRSFKSAAYTYRESEYDRIMDSIGHFDNGNFKDSLSSIGPERWSRVHCPVRRYEFMTSNAAESWNKIILWARDKPIVYVLKCVRQIIQQWFHTRSRDAKSSQGDLSTEVTSKLSKLTKFCDKLRVESLSFDRYKVLHGVKSYIVDLSERSCECCEFQSLGIPCLHALAAIRHANYDVKNFVEECYTSVHLKKIWGGSVMLVPHPKEWVVPPHIKSINCHSPPCPRQAGRPRKSRKHSHFMEGSSSRRTNQQCSRCKQPNHNRINCDVYIPSGTPDAEESDLPQSNRDNLPGRQPRRCSMCGDLGHTKRKCPRPIDV